MCIRDSALLAAIVGPDELVASETLLRRKLLLRRMPMGGIGGIFNLYFILKLLNS